ncbi:MAG: twitching motility protein PilT [Actinomycetota bacterium]|nr:twitching motility protein PilT [Actinomycetota bacterium]
MSALVLDAGALIAVERFDRSIWALLAEARERGTENFVPSTVLAQAWRGGPRSAPIARLLEACAVDQLDERRAKEVGIRLGARGVSDVPDAHVACCATARKAAIATSDPDDIAALTEPGAEIPLIAI